MTLLSALVNKPAILQKNGAPSDSALSCVYFSLKAFLKRQSSQIHHNIFLVLSPGRADSDSRQANFGLLFVLFSFLFLFLPRCRMCFNVCKTVLFFFPLSLTWTRKASEDRCDLEECEEQCHGDM